MSAAYEFVEVRADLSGRTVFLYLRLAPRYFWGAQGSSKDAKNSGGPCHPVVVRPISLILT